MKKKTLILLVDDEEIFLRNMEEILSAAGYDVLKASSEESALALVREKNPDIMLQDMCLPGTDGIEILKKAKQINPEIIVIMVSGYGTIDLAVKAVKLGAYDFLKKPIRIDPLKLAINRALEVKSMRDEIFNLRTSSNEKSFRVEDTLIGKSAAIKGVYDMVYRVADTPNSTVLILGESGTGKELVARAIHAISTKGKEGKFVDINCAALTESLLESELFGYESGAFTGASKKGKIGLFEAANDGCIFLDEIGEMALSLQAKLLRVLQEKTVRHIGGLNDIPINTRVIASTNRALKEEVANKGFREDLYYRLNVFPITIPPLRERKEDIILLAKHFVKQFNSECGKDVRVISDDAQKMLYEYEWPGNVRELANVIERAMILSNGDTINTDNMALDQKITLDKDSSGETNNCTLAEMERKHIINVLESENGQRASSARILGINRTTLYNKMKEYDLKKS
ncbi:MAG: sigma-54-dependent transcriptional regulator [Candidatus Anammoxibacter sp.]